jgi:hypothetical protein
VLEHTTWAQGNGPLQSASYLRCLYGRSFRTATTAPSFVTLTALVLRRLTENERQLGLPGDREQRTHSLSQPRNQAISSARFFDLVTAPLPKGIPVSRAVAAVA